MHVTAKNLTLVFVLKNHVLIQKHDGGTCNRGKSRRSQNYTPSSHTSYKSLKV